VQIANWDTAWIKIVPLAAKSTLGMMSPDDIEQKAQICMDLKKWDCVESEYNHAARIDASKWMRAGHFEMQRAKYNEAAQSYYKFFQNGGQDLEASYNYAKALAQLGQVDEAVKYFDQVLAARPDVLQITVVQNYVKLLMEHQRYNQAKNLIDKVRSEGGPTAGEFMEPEFEKIHDMLTASRA
jgi:tetratricopeptide (TPR) repeat protein